MTQSYDISTVFDYPFVLSSIKKADNQTNLLGQQTNYKLNFQSPTLQTSPQKQQQRIYNKRLTDQQNQPNLDNESSIDFQEQQQIDEYDDQQQIQFLQQQIVQKLSQQFSFIKQKLKKKEQEKQNLLKYYRQICTYHPETENNQNFTNDVSHTYEKKKINPLNTKKIKEKIVKFIEEQSQVSTKKQLKILKEVKKNNITNNQPNWNNQGPKNVFINNIRIQNFKLQKQTPYFSKQNQVKNVIYRTNNDQFKLIQQISQQLKKMQFKKIQDIAQGKFHFSKKK